MDELAECLATTAKWLRKSSSLFDAAPNWVQTYVLPTIALDAPELLELGARVLQSSPLPSRPSEWPQAAVKLEMGELLRSVPHAGFCLLLVSFAVAALVRLAALLRPRWRSPPRSYWLTRVLLLRGMGLIYLAAFATSAAQSRALFGTAGLTPSLERPSRRPSPVFDVFGRSDLMLETVSWLGVGLSLLLMCGVVQWAGVLLALWLMYLSLVNLGARVLIGYGWEWATCEVGFLMIFLGTEWPTLSAFPRALPPPPIVLWLLRWYTFRLLIGAGQSKIGERSSACWKQLTCTTTHYFTQPMPNAFAWFFHHLPLSAHRFEVAITFVEQLALPFLVLMPSRHLNIFACLAELALQLGIVGTGNYAWINFIGGLPALSLLDDQFLSRLLPRSLCAQAAMATGAPHQSLDNPTPSARSPSASPAETDGPRAARSLLRRAYSSYRCLVHLALLALLLAKSAAPLKELFTPAPWLAYYDDYFFVNAQGVFGFINTHRVVLVLSYTHDDLPPNRSAVTSSARCSDTPGQIGTDQTGAPLTCEMVGRFCSSNPHLYDICPRACGMCDRGKWTSAAMSEVRWLPLEFQNLPGEPTRRPSFNSPYHYRLDWETWIATTASMEHYAKGRRASLKLPERDRAAGLVDIPVPSHVSTLIRKVMLGDTDAMGLLRTPESALLKRQGPGQTLTGPTAIRAEYYKYTFSDWPALWLDGRWWEREMLGHAVVFEAPELDPRLRSTSAPIIRSPPQRFWLLSGGVVGVAFALNQMLHGQDSSMLSTGLSGVALLVYGLIMGLTLTVDYPAHSTAEAVAFVTKALTNSPELGHFVAIQQILLLVNTVIVISVISLPLQSLQFTRDRNRHGERASVGQNMLWHLAIPHATLSLSLLFLSHRAQTWMSESH